VTGRGMAWWWSAGACGAGGAGRAEEGRGTEQQGMCETAWPRAGAYQTVRTRLIESWECPPPFHCFIVREDLSAAVRALPLHLQSPSTHPQQLISTAPEEPPSTDLWPNGAPKAEPRKVRGLCAVRAFGAFVVSFVRFFIRGGFFIPAPLPGT